MLLEGFDTAVRYQSPKQTQKNENYSLLHMGYTCSDRIRNDNLWVTGVNTTIRRVICRQERIPKTQGLCQLQVDVYAQQGTARSKTLEAEWLPSDQKYMFLEVIKETFKMFSISLISIDTANGKSYGL
jgi:hypothetical protein